jgi:hypothetical protein
MAIMSMLKATIVLALVGQAISQEWTPANCTTVQMPASFTSSHTLPDPFLKFDGTRVSTKAQWVCRREEIRALMQTYELGPKPMTSKVMATYSSGTLSITVNDNGKSIRFTAAVRGAGSGSSPVPAVIGLGGASLPMPSGVATITYQNEQIAKTNPRGQGFFYDLYGANHKAGGLMAWAWGVSRIVDALEQLGPSVTGIDTKKLAVTGCSRNGKGAMMAGAFDDRIALTLPQEGGSGAAGCWRLATEMKRQGKDIEDANQIITGDGWFSRDFEPYAPKIDTLPEDHHFLVSLIAPRGLVVIENSGIDYLGPMSSYGCSKATEKVFNALGASDAFGYSAANHGTSHCQLPTSQRNVVLAFANKFLLGQTAQTDIFETEGKFDFQESQWIDWTAPTIT